MRSIYKKGELDIYSVEILEIGYTDVTVSTVGVDGSPEQTCFTIQLSNRRNEPQQGDWITTGREGMESSDSELIIYFLQKMMFNRQHGREQMKAYEAAQRIVKDKSYVRRWIEASSFFGTVATSDVIKEKYFITEDYFMNKTIFASRKITPGGIETISGAVDTYEEAKQAIIDDIEEE